MSDKKGSTVLLLMLFACFGIVLYPTVVSTVSLAVPAGSFLILVVPWLWIFVIVCLILGAIATVLK